MGRGRRNLVGCKKKRKEVGGAHKLWGEKTMAGAKSRGLWNITPQLGGVPREEWIILKRKKTEYQR